MQTQAITVELQLAGLRVFGVREDAWALRRGWVIEVVAEYDISEVACPHCGRTTLTSEGTTREVYDARAQRPPK